jgi:hypothetical protein
MIKEAIEFIQQTSKPTIYPVGDKTFASNKLIEVKPDPKKLPTQVNVSTLRGLVDLIEAQLEPDWIKDGTVYIHINDHTRVTLNQKASDEEGRAHTFVIATLPKVDGFKFATFLDHESFIIGLQANFAPTDDRDYLLKIASSLTAETVATSDDDGISQRVGLRSGAVLKTSEVLRSRVTLAPFRTFREVEQPASEFVFRVRQQGDALALYEADGGKWKLDATETIARYFRTAVKDIPIVA